MSICKTLMNITFFFSLFLFFQIANAEANNKSKPIDIIITKAKIYIGKSELNTPSNEKELTAILGKYTRSNDGVLTWDHVGIEIFRGYKNSKYVRSFQIYLKKRTPFEKPKLDPFGELSIDMRPIHDFSGKLTIDGFEVTKNTTLQELNKSRRGLEFNKEAIYRTYSRSYLPDPKNKSFSCTIYIKLTDGYKIYQVSRSCRDWKQYKVNTNTEKKKNKTKTKETPKDIDGFGALMDSNSRKNYQEKYKLSDSQLIEFEKRLAKYKDKKQKTFIEKIKVIDIKLEKGEITKKQAERLAIQLLYPGLTPEKIAAQNNARQEIKKNKDEMTEKDQAALEAGFNMMMLKDMFGGDSSDEKAIQKIVDQVKKEITD